MLSKGISVQKFMEFNTSRIVVAIKQVTVQVTSEHDGALRIVHEGELKLFVKFF